jgi:hypothetical protein
MTQLQPRPKFTAPSAVARARAAVGHGTYLLGGNSADVDGENDCVGFAMSYCYGVPRHRPGYNRGADNRRGDVEDDINCNSMLDDMERGHDLVRKVDLTTENPAEGDLLMYPTIHLTLSDGRPFSTCGHVKMVVGASRWIAATLAERASKGWRLLDTVEMCGPNGHHPGIITGTGDTMSQHDASWGKTEHRSWLGRVVP